MKTEQIIVGTKDELVTHFLEETERYRKMFSTKDDYHLASELGFRQQLDKIENENGIGLIFFMDASIDESRLIDGVPTVEMRLMSSYVRIKNPTNLDDVFPKK